MPRPVDEKARYRIKLHVTKGYAYASTQPPIIDPATGTKRYSYVHWGTLEDGDRFIPNKTYLTADIIEREKLIFPDGWDMSEVSKLKSAIQRKSDTPHLGKQYDNCLYGDIWLLEQVAEHTGIRQDLEIVFEGDKELVDDIITLAMFPFLTQHTYNRVARWQRIVKAPSSRELTPSVITKLTQAITESNRMDLLKLRASRLSEGELCVVDSTTRAAYGDSLTDIRWGKNKENLPLPQTMETVVYSVSSHMPVYYRTFPGNMPDSRSMDVILEDLEYAGFGGLILITDRGYETIKNLEKCISKGQSVVMCTKTSQKDITDAIIRLGDFGVRPDGMKVDADAKIYYAQHELSRKVDGFTEETPKQLKLNLYFDSVRRSVELMEMDICITLQSAALADMQKNKTILGNDSAIKREFCYYDITFYAKSRRIKSYALNEKKVEKARRLSGFFSIVTHGVDYDAMKTYDIYGLRDEQEKYFQQMKDQMCADRQRNWSEEGKTGRLFILFVSLILSSYVRHIWKTTSLRDIFSSTLEVLDEMRSIRFVEHESESPHITSFVGAQVEICKQFGFEIPKGCKPAFPTKISRKGKRGRPSHKITD